jgi:prolyl-tRNA synthetase
MAGEKFIEADLIGCPYRLVMSEKTVKEGSVEIKRRNSQKIELVKLNKVIEKLK